MKNRNTGTHEINDCENFKTGLINGDMGCGKSVGMCYIAKYHILAHNAVPIVYVAKSGDVANFEASIRTFNADLEKQAARHGYKMGPPLKYVRASDIKVDKNNELVDDKNIESLFDLGNTSRTIIVALAHQSQMYKIFRLRMEAVKRDEVKPIVTFFDEAHKKLFPGEHDHKEFVIPWDDMMQLDTVWPLKITKYEIITQFCELSSRNYLVTATPMQTFISDKFPVSFILKVGRAPTGWLSYVGPCQADYEIIEPLQKKVKPVDDPQWIEHLEKWTTMKWKHRSQIPYIIDFSSTLKASHAEKADYVHNEYPNYFTTIVNNCSGYAMTFTDKSVDKIRSEWGGQITVIDSDLKKNRFFITDQNRVLLPCSLPLSSVLQVISDLGRSARRFILITGSRLAEGVCPCSTDYKFAPTHGFYRFVGQPWDDMAQMIARIVNGYQHGPIKRVLYCTKSIQTKLIYGTTFNDIMTQKVIDTLRRNDMNSANDILNSLTISRNRLWNVDIKRLCRAKLTFKYDESDIDDFHTYVDSLGSAKDYSGVCLKIIEDRETDGSKRRRRVRENERYADYKVGENKTKDRSDDIRHIIPTKITNSSTNTETYRTYDRMRTIVMTNGCGIWFDRQEITRVLVGTDGNEDSIKGMMTSIYQVSCDKVDVTERTVGVLMRKVNGKVQIRVNR
ncbi:hypothetical protein N9985_02865 [Gammaproteobacteria bacterium]|nr:hypothetical protein [Gammaproteobacteria bacterium]